MWIALKLPLVAEKSVASFMDQREYIIIYQEKYIEVYIEYLIECM